MSLLGMNPDVAGQVARGLDELSPVFATFDVAFVRTGGTEGDAQTDDETENGEENVGYVELILEMRHAGDDGGPDGDEEQGNDHARCDAAFDLEKIGQSAVFLQVARLGSELVGHGACVTAIDGSEALIG